MRSLMLALALSSVVSAQTVYTPGNGVTLPQVIREVKPQYTQEAKDAHIQGTVVVDAVILTDGNVDQNVKVARSLDPTYGLDNEAVKAARQWKFKPGTKNGEPVAVRVQIELTFRLK